MAEEIQVTVDDTQEEVSLFIGDGSKVTEQELVDLFVAFINKANVFTENQTITKADPRITLINTSGGAKTAVLRNDGSVFQILLGSSTLTFDESLGWYPSTAVNLGRVGFEWVKGLFSDTVKALGFETISSASTNNFLKSNGDVDTTTKGLIDTNTAKVGVTNEEENTINTELEAGMTGEDLVLNVLSLTQAEYDAGTPVSTTFYIITD